MSSRSGITTQAWSNSSTSITSITQTCYLKKLKAASSTPNPFLIKFNSISTKPGGGGGGVGVGVLSPYPNGSKPIFRPLMEWQHCTVKKEVDVPISVAYQCYSDREAMSQWMPFISSVKVLQDKPDLSKWSLKYNAFGRDIQFSWLARNLEPIPNQKIHWRSLEGLPNSGAVRFYPKGASSCLIELTVSYEVPQILVPVASALQPFLQSLLMNGLERFSNFAKNYEPKSST